MATRSLLPRHVGTRRCAPSFEISHHGDFPLAKQQNTFEKRRREVEKRRKAETKLERRRQRKEAQARPPVVPAPPPEETPQ